MLYWRIAIVPTDAGVDFEQVRRVADAVQRQVTEDFAPWWGIDGTIAARRRVEDVPDDYFVIQLVSRLGQAAVEGFHYFNELNQPHALVRTDREDWSLICSHEVLEMLGDPTGNLTRPGPPLGKTTGLVEYLQEVCDPCQHRRNAYKLNEIVVSDFYGPEYFDAAPRPGVQYSIRGTITAPRQLLPGGYICYSDGRAGWIRATLEDGAVRTRKIAGKVDLYSRSIREHIDRDSAKKGLADCFCELSGVEKGVCLQQQRQTEPQRGENSAWAETRRQFLRAFLKGKKSRAMQRGDAR